ncbi:hypothetical protein DMENIID0001_121230 [Sergentomyia squamirostris]
MEGNKSPIIERRVTRHTTRQNMIIIDQSQPGPSKVNDHAQDINENIVDDILHSPESSVRTEERGRHSDPTKVLDYEDEEALPRRSVQDTSPVVIEDAIQNEDAPYAVFDRMLEISSNEYEMWPMDSYTLSSSNLWKWMSNDPELLKLLSKDQIEAKFLELKETDTIKTLGIQWHPQDDQFSYSVNSRSPKGELRLFLQHSASLWATLAVLSIPPYPIPSAHFVATAILEE